MIMYLKDNQEIMKNTFRILLLLARPAAGKSEIIDHLKKTPLLERIQRYHIGEIDVIDDFPILWQWFEEDKILSQLGHPRLYTDRDGMFLHHYFWDLLIEHICLAYQKIIIDDDSYHRRKTTIIEFSRGSEHGGYTRAFKHLSKDIIKKMSILYINVSWEESLRKNRARFNPKRPHSILEHGLPDGKLKKLYRNVDWDDITAGNNHFLEIQNVMVPYCIFENEDDVTTQRGELFSSRLEETLGRLWELSNRQANE
jgi:hypothetical protein